MRVHVMMIVRNEADRFLERSLQNAARIAELGGGVLSVTDDCSDDGLTQDLCRKYATHLHVNERPLFWENEAVARQNNYDKLGEVCKPGDWVLSLDADETISDPEGLVDAVLTRGAPYLVASIPLYEFWDEQHYRTDGYWFGTNTSRLFAWQQGGKFNDRDFACFVPGTLVRTWEGYKSIEDIQIGDRVLASDGMYHGVLETMEREYEGRICEIATRSNIDPLLVTPDHPLLALHGEHVRRNHRGYCIPWICERGKGLNYTGGRFGNLVISHNVEWTPAHDVDKKGWLAVNWPQESVDRESIDVPSRYWGVRRKGPRRFDVDDEFLWAIGLYIAEGSASGASFRYSLHENEHDLIDRIRKFWTRMGFTASLHGKRSSKGVEVVISSKMIGEWFRDWLGHSCYTKAVPYEILNLPAERLRPLIQGVYDGDGRRARLDEQFYGNLHQTSRMLAYQITEILLRLGYYPTNSIQDEFDKARAYTVEGSMSDPREFKRGFWEIDGQLLSQVTDVDEGDYAGKVYNLRVSGDPTYTVGSTLVHNCGSEPTYVAEAWSRGKILKLPDIHLQHWGYSRPEERLRKHARYTQRLGGHGHNNAHVGSIVDLNPSLRRYPQ